MADDPDDRPHSVSEAREMAKRALRGEPPARARRRRGAKTRGTKEATPKAATPKAATPKAATPKAATPKAATPKAATRKHAAPTKRALPAAAVAKRTASKVAAAKRAARKVGAAKLPSRRRAAAPQVTRRRALAAGGALTLGAAAGLLLGTSPDPEPARAHTVTVGGLSVTVPSGRHRVDYGASGLAVRTPGSLLRGRVVERRLPPRPEARPVQLGAFQAWRNSADGVVRYSIPTSQGTLALSCRTTASVSSRPLRLCERTASTVMLRDASALPLAAATDQSRRLRTAIATLRAERDAARARLGSASTPNDQRLAARDLAESHDRAATALRELTGAGPLEASARGAADAYSRLAAAAGSGSAQRWAQASGQVRSSEAELAEAVAAAG